MKENNRGEASNLLRPFPCRLDIPTSDYPGLIAPRAFISKRLLGNDEGRKVLLKPL